jgi:hypothetical protein
MSVDSSSDHSLGDYCSWLSYRDCLFGLKRDPILMSATGGKRTLSGRGSVLSICPAHRETL